MAQQPLPTQDDLRRFLADRDAACPACGYNLRGLTGPTCPECNQHLELRVALSEPRLGAYLAAITGLLSGGGIAVVFLGIVAFISLTGKGWPRGREFFPIVVLPLLATGVLLGLAGAMLTPANRRWFRGLQTAGRAWTIAGCWGLTAAFVVWFLVRVFRM